ncbi:MAG: magnesium transporter, partial [Chromatocurvus sp.]
MSSSETQHTSKAQDRLSEALAQGSLADVRRILLKMEPADVAHLLASSTPRHRQVLWQMIEGELEGEVLNELSPELRLEFLSSMEPGDLAQLAATLDDDDVADILQQLPDRVTFEVLDA